MASQRVRALEEGWYGLELIKPGREFSMDESVMKKDDKGKAVLPRWVEAVEKPAKAVGKGKEDKQEPEPLESADQPQGKGKDVI